MISLLTLILSTDNGKLLLKYTILKNNHSGKHIKQKKKKSLKNVTTIRYQICHQNKYEYYFIGLYVEESKIISRSDMVTVTQIYSIF